ncbi:retrotransposon protein [Tanacetum coccineum]
MTENRRLFTSYKEYDDGHVVFRSNLKGKVVGGGNISHDSITIKNVEHDCAISKNNKMLAKGHGINGLYTCKLGDNTKKQICIASVVDNSILWHRRLGHANMRLVQNIASNKLVRNLSKLSFERHFCDTCGLGSQGNANNKTRKEVSTNRVLELLHLDLVGPSSIQSYGGRKQALEQEMRDSDVETSKRRISRPFTTKAYIVLNKETMRIEESLNVTFVESLPEPKSSSLVEDDRIDEPELQDRNRSPSL